VPSSNPEVDKATIYGRSPGSHINAQAAFPNKTIQWHYSSHSVLTVAGTALD
tara:strand:+ start:8 stop:163 length:156 start_codon:yes stop_codon:yes gene_type:complete